MVVVTKPEIVAQCCCSKCGELKSPDRIVRNRKICKDCCNKKKKETNKKVVIDPSVQITCTLCNITQSITLFVRRGFNTCKDCYNIKRRKHYQENEEFRLKKRTEGIQYKQKKKAIRDEIKQTELTKLEAEIGQDNTICEYCNEIKAKTRFRHNRLKCKDCEREEPLEKFKRGVRSRIHSCLKRNKNKHTHEYLGCMISEYIKWILFNKSNFTLDNHGQVWHIDHVIPLSKFDLKNEQEIMMAFNWRNTMPLLAKENLSKNNKIVKPQIEQHLKTLADYHKENSIELPQVYIDLYARFLEAGNPLEP
jgi:hypothetical protein